MVGGSPAQVRQTVDHVLALIESTTRNLQSGQGVPTTRFIVVERSPETPEIIDLGSTKSGRAKGILALSMVGLALTVLAALEVDRLALKRARTRAPREAGS